MVVGTDTNWRRLAAAILVKAARDAQSDDPALAGPARRWLETKGISLAEWLDLPSEQVTSWLADLPILSWEQLALLL